MNKARDLEIREAAPFRSADFGIVNLKEMAANEGFVLGANWADRHPSEETIERFFQLYNDWSILYEEGKTTDVGFDYVKNHWNDD